MGITLVQKSDLTTPKKNAKVALVLSGGAVSGGAFQLGGLQALERLMTNRNIVDFDMFVGISSGSILSTYLANGVGVEELARCLIRRKGRLRPVSFGDFYAPNVLELLGTPLHMAGDAASIALRKTCGFLLANNLFRKRFRRRLFDLIAHPGSESLERFAAYCLESTTLEVNHPSLPWHYLPRGLFRTDPIERSTRRNLKRNHLSNRFEEIYERNGKELYIVAMNLDSAQRAVFGHDYRNDVLVSQAMQASIAFPVFFKPVEIDGEDYVDGAVIKTTSMDVAFEKGADLIICFNPFRPFDRSAFERLAHRRSRISITRDGVVAVLSQVLRTMLHTRLMHGLELYRKNPAFTGDILLIEPTDDDDLFFDLNPLSYATYKKAAARGFSSVSGSLTRHYGEIHRLLSAHGIETRPQDVKPQPDGRVAGAPHGAGAAAFCTGDS
jgi:NTE family protein